MTSEGREWFSRFVDASRDEAEQMWDAEVARREAENQQDALQWFWWVGLPAMRERDVRGTV